MADNDSAQLREGFEDKLLDIAAWVDENKYLNSIKDAFTAFMPFVIVGSFGSLLNTLICSTSIGLAAIIPQAAALSPAFSAINYCCLSFMTIPVIFLVAYNIGKHNNVDPVATGIACLCAYISMVPESFSTTIDLVSYIASLPESVTIADGTTSASLTLSSLSAIPSTVFGAQGLFVGMLTAIFVGELFDKLCTIEAIKIKMPPSVPGGIAKSFNIMIPVALTLIITSVFGLVFRLVSGDYVNNMIYTWLQAPMEALFQTAPGIIIAVALSQLFWFLGIHGGLVVSPVRNAIWAAAIAANVASVAAGSDPTQIFTMGFWMCFVAQGGAGMTLCLLFAIFIASKRDDYRSVAKLAIVPGIFGISEPVVFGIPLVLNPTFAIPFIFNSSISTAIAMFALNIGFLTPNTFDVPFGVPVLLNAFMSYGWQGVVVQAITFVVCTLVWIPFVLISNHEKVEEAEA